MPVPDPPAPGLPNPGLPERRPRDASAHPRWHLWVALTIVAMAMSVVEALIPAGWFETATRGIAGYAMARALLFVWYER